jgi:transposase
MLGDMKTYSLNSRKRLLAATDHEMSGKEAVHVFGVSLATIKRWLKRGSPSLSMQRSDPS